MKPRAALILSLSCFISGLFALYLYQKPVTPARLASEINANLAREVAELKRESAQFTKENFCSQKTESENAFYVFKNGTLVCWTDNRLVPPINVLSDTASLQLLIQARSSFLLYKSTLDANTYLVSLLTLTRDYPIHNVYLNREWNQSIFPTGNISVLESASSIGVPIELEGSTIFRISYLASGLSAYPDLGLWCVALLFSGLLFFIVGAYSWLKTRRSPLSLLIHSCVLLVAIRLLLLALAFPRNTLHSQMFSPHEFASSILNPSLGDLWLNVLFMLVISILFFRWYHLHANARILQNVTVRTILSVLLTFMLFAVAQFPVLTLQTIVHNSNINLDITSSLHFSFLRGVTLSAILMTWCTAFFLLHVFIHFLFLQSGRHTYRILIAGSLLFALVNTAEQQPYIPTLVITWLLIFVVYYLKLTDSLQRLQYRTFS